MKILVTVGAAFVGSHMVDALVEQERQVVVIDNSTTGSLENVNPAPNSIESMLSVTMVSDGNWSDWP